MKNSLAFTNSTVNMQATHLTCVHEDPSDLSLNLTNHFNLMDPNAPLIDTKVYATTAWHRTILKEVDPKQLRKYFGWRPVRVIKETLERTTQMAKMIFKHPLL